MESLVSFDSALFKVDFFLFFSSIGDSGSIITSFISILFGMHQVSFLLSFCEDVAAKGKLSTQVSHSQVVLLQM